MKLSAIISAIESLAPVALQEKWDNSGLQVSPPGGNDADIDAALVCVDVTEAVVDEACRRHCGLIVSHHPLIFKPLRTLCGTTPAQRAAIAAVRAGIAVYSAHTSLDSARGGVSHAMAEALGLEVTSVLSPSHLGRTMVVVTCPAARSEAVQIALMDSGVTTCVSTPVQQQRMTVDIGGSVIDASDKCRISFETDALGMASVYRALAGIPDSDDTTVETIALGGSAVGCGIGVIAGVPSGRVLTASGLVAALRRTFGTGAIRAAGYRADAPIRRLALCGGAGGEFIADAFRAGADAYVTADLRYHDMADAAQNHQMLFDIGHYESENCTKSILSAAITKKIPNFAVYKSESDTNPVNYL